MAVVFAQEIHEGRPARADETGLVRFQKVWSARTSDKNEGPLSVAASPSFPAKGLWYMDRVGQVNLWCRCKSLDIQPDAQKRPLGYWWRVTAVFDNQPPRGVGGGAMRSEMGKGGPSGRQGGGAGTFKNDAGMSGGYSPGDRPLHPLLRPVKVSWSSVKLRWGLVKADRLDANLLVVEAGVTPTNSAGDPFEGGISYDQVCSRVTVVRNQLRFDESAILEYVGRMNATPWIGKPRGRWICEDISATEEWEAGVGYWAVTYVFSHNRKGWAIPYIDQGFREFIPPNAEPTAIIETGGSRPARPVKLNGMGRKLSAGAPPVFRYFVPEDAFAEFADFRLV